MAAEARSTKPKVPDTNGASDSSVSLPNARHERFVQLLVDRGLPQSRAYVLAGFTARSANAAMAGASRLLRNVKVQARLSFLQETAAGLAIDAAKTSQSEVLSMLLEQHQRNIGVRPTPIPSIAKDRGEKSGTILITQHRYNGKAANRTIQMLFDAVGLGQGKLGPKQRRRR